MVRNLQGGRQDEEHAASVRIVDGRKKISEAKKTIKEFEEKYQTSFSDFERDLAKNCDERLFYYADWAFWDGGLRSKLLSLRTLWRTLKKRLSSSKSSCANDQLSAAIFYRLNGLALLMQERIKHDLEKQKCVNNRGYSFCGSHLAEKLVTLGSNVKAVNGLW